MTETQKIKKMISSWLNFLSETSSIREEVVSRFKETIEKLDLLVEEQRQVTSFSLRKMLNLTEADKLILKNDGSYEIVKGEFDMNENEKILLNGKEITKEELEFKKEQISTQKGVKLEEVSKNNYVIRIQD